MDKKFDNYLRQETKLDIFTESNVVSVDDIPEFSYSRPGTQEEIKALQVKKDAIMEKLKENLANLDNKEQITPLEYGVTRVIYDEKKNVYEATYKMQPVQITLGQIMTDSMWGIRYRLDPVSVSRSVRKEFLVNGARAEIAQLYDAQIIKHEAYREGYDASRGDYTVRDNIKQKGFQEIDEQHRKKEEKQKQEKNKIPEQFGFIAEKMVKGYLRKLALDYDLKIEIEDVSFDLDMYFRIDCIIKKKPGVSQKNPDVHAVGTEVLSHGIQFTINMSALDHKKDQIASALRNMHALKSEEHIADIALVSFPGSILGQAYKDWEDKKLPGGPDAYLPENIKLQMVEKLLLGYVDSAEEKKHILSAVKKQHKTYARTA